MVESLRPAIVLARDVERHDAANQARHGRLTRLTRGIYRHDDDVATTTSDAHLALVVGLAERFPAWTFSHESAALVHGLWVWSVPRAAQVTTPKPRSTTSRPEVRRHVGALPGDDVCIVNGVRVTALERTVLDCVTSAHPMRALPLVDSWLRRAIDPDRRRRDADDQAAEHLRDQILALLPDRASNRGIARAREVLRYASCWAESPPESILRWIVLAFGLPEPVPQYRVDTPTGTFYTDLAVVDERGKARLHLEFDGFAKYQDDPAAFRAEKRREDSIREVDAPLLRFTFPDIGRPPACAARIVGRLGTFRLTPRPLLRPSRLDPS